MAFVGWHLVMLLSLCGPIAKSAAQRPSDGVAEPEIHLWYGHEQRFGHRGVPQRWVNILGRADLPDSAGLVYQLNGGDQQPLSLGPNFTRLAESGDFNVEIAADQLRSGLNRLTLSAVRGDQVLRTTMVTVDWSPKKASLPYSIDWQQAESIGDLAQVVDGRWELTAGGVRSVAPYYDRVIAFGDRSWTDYEVETTVTFHGRRIPGERDGGRNVIHAAIASRWPGHDEDANQPRVKWYPLGATSEFMVTDWPDGCRWRILGGATRARHSYQESLRTIAFETCYGMKHRVKSLANGETEYRVKLWPADADEPEGWDLIGKEDPDDIAHGGGLLIAHYTDVTFGNVHVVAVDN